ncbi:MAG TPA: DinB family protein [Streptosporangiaceae bacterium]|nr:DinB family protein [Streptosporangiaceae bacterium]
MSDDLSPAQHAAAIEESRQRLSDFVLRCTDTQWKSAPVDGDPRPVAVITDHVAHAYEYLAGWIGDLLAGGSPEVTSDLVDQLNAEHAQSTGSITPAQVAAHLKTSGDALINLIKNLEPGQLTLGDGRIARFAVIAARHADSHTDEIEAAIG